MPCSIATRIPPIEKIIKSPLSHIISTETLEACWGASSSLLLYPNFIVFADSQRFNILNGINGENFQVLKEKKASAIKEVFKISVPSGVQFMPSFKKNLCVTAKCNQKCSHCFIPEKIRDNEDEMLPIIFKAHLNEHRSENITLYGGEPFLYLSKYPSIIPMLPKKTNIISNGSVVDYLLLESIVSQKFALSISLSSSKGSFIEMLPKGYPWIGLVTLTNEMLNSSGSLIERINKYKPRYISLNADYNMLKCFDHHILKRQIEKFLLSLPKEVCLLLKPYWSIFSPSFCPYSAGVASSVTVEGDTAYCQAVISNKDRRYQKFNKVQIGFYENSVFTGCSYYETNMNNKFWKKIKLIEIEIILGLIENRLIQKT